MNSHLIYSHLCHNVGILYLCRFQERSIEIESSNRDLLTNSLISFVISPIIRLLSIVYKLEHFEVNVARLKFKYTFGINEC